MQPEAASLNFESRWQTAIRLCGRWPFASYACSAV